MAKGKKSKKKTASKSRGKRMGALNVKTDQDLLMIAAGVVAGGVVKRLADTLIAKQSSTTGVSIAQNTVDVVQILGGGAVFYLVDQPFVRGLGLGLAGSAIYTKTANLKLSGIGASPLVPFRPRPNLSGAGVTQTPSIAGANVYNFPKPAGVGNARRFAGSHMR
jgi:hypothetical protein